MSYEVATKNGETFNSGFWGTDTTRIMLGELPAMSMEQFSEYVADTLVGHLDMLTDAQLALCEELFGKVRNEALEKRPVRTSINRHSGFESMGNLILQLDDSTDIEEQSELAEALSMANSNALGNVSVQYSENPFVFHNGLIDVGGMYEVEPEEFVHFTTTYLGGGFLGWDENLGVPECVVSAVSRVETALANYS